MKLAFYSLWNDILDFLNRKKSIFCALLLVLVVGVILGIVLGITNDFGDNLISSNDELFSDISKGESSTFDLILSKLTNYLFVCLIIFLSSLSYYTLFINYIFIGYQGIVLSSICVSVIKNSIFTGIINCIALIIPINIVLIFGYTMFSIWCMNRAINAKNYSVSFVSSFRFEKYYWTVLFGILAIYLIFITVLCLIISLFFKSFIFLIV